MNDERVWIRSDGNITAAFDPLTGSLVHLRSDDMEWSILDRPELGRLWTLMLPLAGRRNNVADSRDQDAPLVEGSLDGAGLRLVWDGIRSQHGGRHDVTVDVFVEAHRDGLMFSMTITNDDDLVVENVRYPDLGDVGRPSDAVSFEAFAPHLGSAFRGRLWPSMDNQTGYWGFDHPLYVGPPPSRGAPSSPFVLVRDERRGLFMGIADEPREVVAWVAELIPGLEDSLDERGGSGAIAGGSAPGGDFIDGKPVQLTLAAIHVPYVSPGTTTTLSRVLLTAYSGDWEQGADVYLNRRSGWESQQPPATPEWLADPSPWIQLHVNSYEDELRVPFADLPAIAAECKRFGVTTIQLTGWTQGGQDGLVPGHDADERLGGSAALRDAIEACRELGVRIILYTKFTWATRGTDRFREELIHDSVKDPYGDYYVHQGWQYQTPTQLLDINTPRFVPMCYGSAHYLSVAVEEFHKVLDLHADGMLYDEGQHHVPALLCFDEEHGHRRGEPLQTHDQDLFAALESAARERGEDSFLWGVECAYDREFDWYQLSYFRSDDPQHVPLARYLRPNAAILTASVGFDDRNLLNQCLMYRYLISYEPFNFKGRLPDFATTVNYGNLVESLRLNLRKWFWDGTFVSRKEARVTNEDGAPHPHYSTFVAEDGSVATAVANYSRTETRQFVVDVPTHGDDVLMHRLIDDDTWREGDVIHVPPRSLAIVLPSSQTTPEALDDGASRIGTGGFAHE